MVDRIVGYHFELQFGPMLPALAPLVMERAHAVGIAASPPGYELRPRASMIRVAGTYWSGLRTGEVHFSALEYRSALDGYLLQEVCLTSKQLLCSFGVQEEQKGWTSTKLHKAVGLWLRNGSLVLHAWKDDRCSVPEQVLAEFEMWQALDAMAGLASGDPSFAAALQAPTWARDLATTARTEHAKVQADPSLYRVA
jgi:hypothetical protein